MDGIIVQKHFDGFIEIVKYLHSNIRFGNWSLSCVLFHFVGVYSVSDALLFSLIHWTDVCSSYTSHFLRIFLLHVVLPTIYEFSHQAWVVWKPVNIYLCTHTFWYSFYSLSSSTENFILFFFPLRCKLSGLTRVVNINVYDSSCCFSHSQRNIHRETWWKKKSPQKLEKQKHQI